MSSQTIFKSSYISQLRSSVGKNIKYYLKGDWKIEKENTLQKRDLKELDFKEIKFLDPEGSGKLSHDYENAVTLFEYWKDMDPTQATDLRLWTFLCHGPFMDYLRKRRPIENVPTANKENYILDHWFVLNPGPQALKTNDLFLFWWGPYITYDKDREDPYELTKELFSMLDYTKHLLPGSQGRSRDFAHAVLEYVIDHSELFSTFKEGKVRLIMRRLNYIAGYRTLISLDKQELKSLIDSFRGEIQDVKSKEDQ